MADGTPKSANLTSILLRRRTTKIQEQPKFARAKKYAAELQTSNPNKPDLESHHEQRESQNSLWASLVLKNEKTQHPEKVYQVPIRVLQKWLIAEGMVSDQDKALILIDSQIGPHREADGFITQFEFGKLF